jgi:hypothetical protein
VRFGVDVRDGGGDVEVRHGCSSRAKANGNTTGLPSRRCEDSLARGTHRDLRREAGHSHGVAPSRHGNLGYASGSSCVVA